MQKSTVNLHIHSSYSDGNFSILYLVTALAASGIKTFSITDHDMVIGQKEATEAAKKYNLNYINGIELSCRFTGEGNYWDNFWCHILGYGFDVTKMKKYVEQIDALDAFPTIKEGIDLIHECGGIAVWAHPYYVMYQYKFTLEQKKLLAIAKKMKEYGLDGIEAYYHFYSVNQIKNLELLAEKYNWLKSVGTDYHGWEIREESFSFCKEGIIPDATVLDRFK